MIVESFDHYAIFRKETKCHDILISVISTDDSSFHVAISNVSIVFIKDLETDSTYTFSFNHPDNLHHVDIDMFTIDLPIDRRIWCFDVKSVWQLLNLKDRCIDIDLLTHLQKNCIVDRNECETTAHKLIKRNNPYEKNINNVIPLLKHQEMFERMCDKIRMIVEIPKVSEIDHGLWMENNHILKTLSKLEKIGIHVNKECFKKHFDANVYDGDLVYSQYNIYTSTGRPSNRFADVNYAALNKSDGVRKCFTSRWGKDGKMVLIDYSAFHPRIISYLIKFPLGIDTDIYQYLGELYFGRKVTEYDMDEIKSITMRQFYGGVEEKYQHIKYLSHAKDFIEKYWNEWKQNGCIYTPLFKRVITDKHLKDANPYKLLNYILQATETEIAISVLERVIDYTAFHKTKPVLYTYDSILFDFYNPDGKTMLDGITNIMKMGNRFPIKIYEGDSYDSVSQISP